MEQIFLVTRSYDQINFFITFKNKYYNVFKGRNDINIANGIGITLEEYQNILQKFNAIFIDKEYWFKKQRDAILCCEFLNETYGMLIALSI